MKSEIQNSARPAFTLKELLTVVGIISILTGMVIPVVGRARISARQTLELSNLRQLTAGCIAYAQDHNDLLPAGRALSQPPNEDDYTWLSLKNCWTPLNRYVPDLSRINSCASVRDTYPGADNFGKVNWGSDYYGDTQVGWIYWGGRDDLFVNGKLAYRSPRRLAQHLTPGSQTIWTCLCWDSAGNGDASVCPHVGTNCAIYASGVALKPPPDGLGVAIDDGSASFVKWNDLIIIQQSNGYKLYYQP